MTKELKLFEVTRVGQIDGEIVVHFYGPQSKIHNVTLDTDQAIKYDLTDGDVLPEELRPTQKPLPDLPMR